MKPFCLQPTAGHHEGHRGQDHAGSRRTGAANGLHVDAVGDDADARSRQTHALEDRHDPPGHADRQVGTEQRPAGHALPAIVDAMLEGHVRARLDGHGQRPAGQPRCERGEQQSVPHLTSPPRPRRSEGRGGQGGTPDDLCAPRRRRRRRRVPDHQPVRHDGPVGGTVEDSEQDDLRTGTAPAIGPVRGDPDRTVVIEVGLDEQDPQPPPPVPADRCPGEAASGPVTEVPAQLEGVLAPPHSAAQPR